MLGVGSNKRGKEGGGARGQRTDKEQSGGDEKSLEERNG